jgi:membrane associated rhomboid family serine protease
MSGVGPEVDASVCYRHPDRTSWTLCERCGRTICPECQILTPQGVRCPTCIEELGGSVQWTPASGPRPAPKPVKRKRVRVRSGAALDDRPAWQRVALGMLRPGDESPVISWATAAIATAVWLVGLFTPVLSLWLVALPGLGWQVWRFVTASIASAPGASLAGVLSFVLSVLVFLLTAPLAERQLGRRRFVVVLLAAGIAGAAAAVIVGYPGYGLYGIIYGLFGATLIQVWSSPGLRTQLLVMIGVYVLITLILSPALLPAIVGGILGGTGAAFIERRFEEHRSRRVPYGLIAGGLAVLVVIAIVRGLL